MIPANATRVIEARIYRSIDIRGETVSGNGSNNTIDIDFANALIEEIADINISGVIGAKIARAVELRGVATSVSETRYSCPRIGGNKSCLIYFTYAMIAICYESIS